MSTNPESLGEQRRHRSHLGWHRAMLGLLSAFWFPQCWAQNLTLQSIDFASLPNENLQIQMQFDGPTTQPRIFHTDNPARVAVDLPGVRIGATAKSIPVNVHGVSNIQTVEGVGRTRVVINLEAMSPYTSRVEGNRLALTLQTGKTSTVTRQAEATTAAKRHEKPPGRQLENIDFRRGDQGEGRVLITLSDPQTVADIHEEGQKVVLRFPETALPVHLARNYDVLDFATPVKTIEAQSEGEQVRMTVTPTSGNYEYSSFQTENLLTVEFRPLSKAEKDEIKRKSLTYTGDRLSLNFQDIPVRQVLQILADFTNLNIVASDSVQGNITLRLNEVPWDQALELVLKAKGLGKRLEGNIMRVAPTEEINKLEKEDLEAQKVVEDLEPLKTEIIQINYTKAEDIKKVLVGTTERTSTSLSADNAIGDGEYTKSRSTLDLSQSILSGRGNVTVDPRTNQLIVKDTARNLERVRDLVRQLDKPIRQVLIESRIVIANNDFTRQLGARLGVNRFDGRARTIGGEFVPGIPPNSGSTGDALVDLAAPLAAGAGGFAGFTLLKAGDYILDLELSAAQKDGRGEVVSNPRLITSDKTKATIKQGVEIPYQVQSSAGGALISNIQFKQAVLELNVTPHITPDDHVSMDLLVKKDSQGQDTAAGPTIDKREIETTALVGNGETVVLGGVYEGTKATNTDKVPFFGDLPGVGFMFRRDTVTDTKKELLIFITPKILKQSISMR